MPAVGFWCVGKHPCRHPQGISPLKNHHQRLNMGELVVDWFRVIVLP